MSIALAFPSSTKPIHSQDSVTLSADHASNSASKPSRPDTLSPLATLLSSESGTHRKPLDNALSITQANSMEENLIIDRRKGDELTTEKNGYLDDPNKLALAPDSPVRPGLPSAGSDHMAEITVSHPDPEREEGELEEDIALEPTSNDDGEEEGLIDHPSEPPSYLPAAKSSTSTMSLQASSSACLRLSTHVLEKRSSDEGSLEELHNGIREALVLPFLMNLEKRGDRQDASQETARADMGKLFTDERCNEFNALAKLVCRQLEDRGLEKTWPPEVGRREDSLQTKRTQDDGPGSTPPAKRRRLNHDPETTTTISSKMTSIREHEPADTFINAPSSAESISSNFRQHLPTAPRAMVSDPKIAAVERFLSLVENSSRAAESRTRTTSRAQSTQSGYHHFNTVRAEAHQESVQMSSRHPPSSQTPEKNHKDTGSGQHPAAVAHSAVDYATMNGHEDEDKGASTISSTPPTQNGRPASSEPRPQEVYSHTCYRMPASMKRATPIEQSSAASNALAVHKGSHATGTEHVDPSAMGIVLFTRAHDGVVEVHPADQPPPRALHVGHPIPALWQVKFGHPSRVIATIDFNVEPRFAAAVKRWTSRDVQFDPMEHHVAMHLLCIPVGALSDIVEKANNGTLSSHSAIADAVWQVRTQWPPRGNVILSMNEGQPSARTWLPEDLVDGLPLDISSAVQPHANVLQIIPLANLSQFVFAVHVAEPSAQQLRRLDMGPEHPSLLSDLLESVRPRMGTFSFPS